MCLVGCFVVLGGRTVALFLPVSTIYPPLRGISGCIQDQSKTEIAPRKIHCQPDNPPFPSKVNNAAPSNGETAVPPNIPKKNIAIRFVSSSLVYQHDKVYIAPGIYPASAKPRNVLVTRNPALFCTKICSAAMMPNIRTCPPIHHRGPIYTGHVSCDLLIFRACIGIFTECRIIFEGISRTITPRNISWFPRLIVLWSTLMAAANPPVNTLEIFVRSN